jgi:hypothetical protein
VPPEAFPTDGSLKKDRNRDGDRLGRLFLLIPPGSYKATPEPNNSMVEGSGMADTSPERTAKANQGMILIANGLLIVTEVEGIRPDSIRRLQRTKPIEIWLHVTESTESCGTDPLTLHRFLISLPVQVELDTVLSRQVGSRQSIKPPTVRLFAQFTAACQDIWPSASNTEIFGKLTSPIQVTIKPLSYTNRTGAPPGTPCPRSINVACPSPVRPTPARPPPTPALGKPTLTLSFPILVPPPCRRFI